MNKKQSKETVKQNSIYSGGEKRQAEEEHRQMICPFTINPQAAQERQKLRAEEKEHRQMIRPLTIDPLAAQERERQKLRAEEEEHRQMIRPFTIDSQAAQERERKRLEELEKVTMEIHGAVGENQNLKNSSEGVQKTIPISSERTRPFDYIPDFVKELADSMMPKPTLYRSQLAGAIYGYIQEGGKILDIQQGISGSTSKKMFNFGVSLKKRIVRIWDTKDGEEEELSYGVEVRVVLKNGGIKIFNAEVEHNKIKMTASMTNATNSLANTPKTKDEKIDYENVIQNCIEQDAEEERIYPNAGWRNIPKLGWRYVYKHGIVGGTENIHTKGQAYSLDVNPNCIGDKRVFDNVIQMSNICKNKRTSLEILLFVHAGLLTTLFEKSGHQLDFSLMVVAPTNSRKTSMVTAMAKVFDREELKADAEFATATNAGIEKMLGTYKDASVIIDDFKPGANLAEQREIDRKLDEVLRFFGDRVTKKRMTDFAPNAEKLYFAIGGNCIITGEYAPNTIESSLTRLFLTEMTNEDVQNDLLIVYQEERWLLPTHTYDFLAWVTTHFDECIGIICVEYSQRRSQKSFTVGRFSGMYATLMCVAKILCKYAEQKGFWTYGEEEAFCGYVEEAVLLELSIMEERLQRRDKATKVLEILKKAIETGKAVAVWLNKETCGECAMLYEDQDIYYVSTKYLREIINTGSKNVPDMPLINNSDEMISLLDRKGALVVDERDGKRTCSRKLPMQRGNNKRYLYLKKSALQKLED